MTDHRPLFRIGLIFLAAAFQVCAAQSVPPAEAATDVLNRAIKLYSEADSFSGKIYTRQVFFSPAIALFDPMPRPPQNFGPVYYQVVTVRVHRPGTWLVRGDLSADLAVGRSTPPPQGYVLGLSGGLNGRYAVISPTDSPVVSELAPQSATDLLRTRLLAKGGFALEPLFSPAGKYAPAEFPVDKPQIDGEETYQGRVFYRLRTHGKNEAMAILWIEKANAQIVRTVTFAGSQPQQFTETLYMEQQFNPVLPADSLVFAVPEHPTPPVASGLGFTNLYEMAAALPGLLQPPPVEPPPQVVVRASAPPPPRALSAEQMASVVFIAGDRGTGTGFVAKIRDIPCVVTNLHVLGNNEEFKVKTLGGEPLAVQGISAAIGRDIALLRIVGPLPAGLAPLPLAPDVVKAAQEGDAVVVAGDRLGAGITAQTGGRLVGFGPARVEVSATFQNGNDGGPIINLATGEVLGVATYALSAIVDADTLLQARTSGLSSVSAPRLQTSRGGVIPADARWSGYFRTDTRWFGYRLDSVSNWEAIDWNKWHAQMARLGEFQAASQALLAFLRHDLSNAKLDLLIRNQIERFQTRITRSDVLTSRRTKAEAITVELHDLVASIRTYGEDGQRKFSPDAFYDYFRTSLYWEHNVVEQKKLRDLLIGLLKDSEKDPTAYQRMLVP